MKPIRASDGDGAGTAHATRTRTRDRVIVFDTTLRDGEQCPGASLTLSEKLEVARALASLRVDVIEAGFPAASAGDHDAVRRIARTVGRPEDPHEHCPTICGLARASAKDIERAWDAVKDARKPRIHVFLGTSPTHRKDKLGLSKQDVLERVEAAVALATDLCDDVQFSPEDASRTELPFLARVVQRAVDAGAGTINIPDTVGYATPADYHARISGLVRWVDGLENRVVSVHCHDDLGLATANTLAGIQAGARQAEVTLNGIGERAGNTALEELVMAVRTRRDAYAVDVGVEARGLREASQLVSRLTGFPVPPNKAVVGVNAFRHEAGIHQHGVVKNAATYEIMDPASVGATQELVLGKHSGRHALAAHLEARGIRLDENALTRVSQRLKEIADEAKRVTPADVDAALDAVSSALPADAAPARSSARARRNGERRTTK